MSGQGRPELTTVDAGGLTLAIAATRWHAEITDSLVDRAMAAAKACGVTSMRRDCVKFLSMQGHPLDFCQCGIAAPHHLRSH